MILRNSGICKQCKDHLVSRHRHDFVSCSCGKSFVDGGLEYLRRNVDNFIETSIYSTDPLEVLQEGFEWGTRGKDGKQPLKYVKLKDISDRHLIKILDMFKGQDTEIAEVFHKEYDYRGLNG